MRRKRLWGRKILAVFLSTAIVCASADVQALAVETNVEESVADAAENETEEHKGDTPAVETETTSVPTESENPSETDGQETTGTESADEESESGETETLPEQESETEGETENVTEETETEAEDGKALLAGEDGIASGTVNDISWEIDSDGKLTVTGTGDYDGSAPWYEHADKITSAVINVSSMTSAAFMFSDCSNLITVDLTNFDTSSLQYASYMFFGCSSLESPDLSGFNTENVTDMEAMFSGCSSLESLDLSKFKTDRVRNMSEMFGGCERLTDLKISNLNTENVKNMNYMFSGCAGLGSLDLGSFNTEKVTDMQHMFSRCGSLSSLKLGSFNTGNVTDMSGMFDGCSNLGSLDLGSFDTGNVTDMGFIFSECSSLVSLDLSSWDLSSLKEAEGVFSDCENLEEIYTPRNLSAAISLEGSWYRLGESGYLTELPKGLDYSILITKGRLPSVTDAHIEAVKQKTVYEAGDDLNLDDLTVRYYGTDGKVINVTDYTTNSADINMSEVGEKELKITYKDSDNKEFTAIVNLTVREARGNIAEGMTRNLTWKIDGKGKLTVTGTGDYDRRNTYDAPWYEHRLSIKTAEIDVTDMTNAGNMFAECNNLVRIDLSRFDTGSVTDMSYMFADCADLEQLDLSNLKTAQVTDMEAMFSGCSSLKELNLSAFQTGNVTNMGSMFSGCNGLTSINLSSFDTKKVTNMALMFSTCRSLKSLDVSQFDTGSVNTMLGMFSGCKGLKVLDVSCFKTGNVCNMNSMFDGCSSLTELDLSSFDTGKVLGISGMFFMCSSLESLNMSSFDLSGLQEDFVNDISYVEPFEGCDNLSFISTPKNCSISITLPCADGDKWYQEKDKEFTTLPTGLDYSIDLYKNGYPGDGKTKEKLTVTGITINDKTYDRENVSYSGTASAKDSSGKEAQGISFGYVYSGTLVNGSAYNASENAPSEAGDYTLTVKINDNDKYTGQAVYDFRILQKELTITADDDKILVGVELPEFKYTVSGLIEGDALVKEPVLTCSAKTADLEGAYDIIPSGADAGNNYSIRYVNGVLTIGSVIVVKFDLQGHGTQIAPVTVNSGDKLTEPEKPTAEGYTFGGWYKEAACTTVWDFANDTVTADTTLYAKWTPNGAVRYTVTYDMQGHGTQIPPVTVNSGDLLTAPETPTAEGYIFEWWYKEAECINEWLFSDAVTADMTLYAKWTQRQPEEEDKDDSPYTEAERTDLKTVSGTIASIKAKVYDGSPYMPTVKVTVIENGKKKTLTEGHDYRVLYKNNIDAGTGTAIVRGNGIYKGEITKEFTINPKSIKKLKVVTGSIALGNNVSAQIAEEVDRAVETKNTTAENQTAEEIFTETETGATEETIGTEIELAEETTEEELEDVVKEIEEMAIEIEQLNATVGSDLSSFNFPVADIRNPLKTVDFNGSDGKQAVIVFGGIGTCSRTESAVESLSKFAGMVDMSKINMYYFEINKADDNTIKSRTADISSQIIINSIANDASYNNLFRTCFVATVGSGSLSMPLVVYKGTDGNIYKYTTGATDLSAIVKNVEEGGLTVDYNISYQTLNVTGESSYEQAWEVLEILNTERAKEGLDKLEMDSDLLETAMLRAAECSLYYSHTRPDGTECFTASPKISGENISAGRMSAEEAMNGWMNSEGHRKNILTSQYHSVGIGCFYINGTYRWVQCFGTGIAAVCSSKPNQQKTYAIKAVSEHVNPYLVEKSGSLKVGETSQLKVESSHEIYRTSINADSYRWISSDTIVADVNGTGLITAKKIGNTVVTGYNISDENQVLTYNVTVTGTDGEEEPKEEYLVTFDSQGGTKVSSVKATKNATIEEPTIPTRQGYTFGGWYKETSCINVWNFVSDTVTADITLYAKWVLSTGDSSYDETEKTAIPVYVYDGTKLLQKDTDYKLSYDANFSAKKKTKVTVTAMENSNYMGSIVVNLAVYEGEMSNIINPENVTLSDKTAEYTGKAVKSVTPIVKVGTKQLVVNKDYKVQYQNNTNAGTAFVIITGKGVYKGKVVKSFEITTAKTASVTIKPIPAKTYNGKLQKPVVTVKNGNKKLVKNKDYIVSYADNLHAGTATVIITGKGNYAGMRQTTTFTINPQKISKVSVKGTKASGIVVTYNKRVLKEGTDYTFEYGEENKNKVKVTLTGKGDFTGSVTKTVKIQ